MLVEQVRQNRQDLPSPPSFTPAPIPKLGDITAQDIIQANPELEGVPPSLIQNILDDMTDSAGPNRNGPLKLDLVDRDELLNEAKAASDYRVVKDEADGFEIITHMWTGPDGVRKRITLIDAGSMKPEDMRPKAALAKLEKQLAEAIKAEDYETAVAKRDAIDQMKKRIRDQGDE